MAEVSQELRARAASKSGVPGPRIKEGPLSPSASDRSCGPGYRNTLLQESSAHLGFLQVGVCPALPSCVFLDLSHHLSGPAFPQNADNKHLTFRVNTHTQGFSASLPYTISLYSHQSSKENINESAFCQSWGLNPETSSCSKSTLQMSHIPRP